MKRARGVLTAGLLAVALLGAAGCTGVPSSSSPEVIQSLANDQPTPSLTITPQPGASPREIVTDFLDASASDDPHHAAARGFLTAAEQQEWPDTTVTVLDSPQVSNFQHNQILVSGRVIGLISQNGTYAAQLGGEGLSPVAPVQQLAFGMKLVNGQWRIDSVPKGIVISDADFQRLYQPRPLYFFDQAEKHLVADLRYSALTDPALLANWLVQQFVLGPQAQLDNVVVGELPAATDSSHVAAVLGSTTQVQIPGAAVLPLITRAKLAAELALTLQGATSGPISIVDSGRVVPIDGAGTTTFSAINYQNLVLPGLQSPSLYYLNDGDILTNDGTKLSGHAQGQYALTSIAIANAPSGDLRIAGTAANRLYVGTLNTGLRPTAVAGNLTRPTWAPGLNEVWVASGSAVFRVDANLKATSIAVTNPNGTALGRINSLRFSPDGTRIALVVAGSGNTAQVQIGSVLRGANGVASIVNLEVITPPGVAIGDVSWNDQLKLFATGRDLASQEPGIYEVQVDGSLWTARGNGDLPGEAESITIAKDQLAWVSTGQTVWEQRAGGWASPQGGQTAGINPVYTE